MLSRSTLQSCRVSARAATGPLTAVRTNTTAASPAEAAKPRRRIPLANNFGDLQIPDHNAVMHQKDRSPFRMSPSDFDGRGSLSSRLMSKRAKEIARGAKQQSTEQGATQPPPFKLAPPPRNNRQQQQQQQQQSRPRRASPRQTAGWVGVGTAKARGANSGKADEDAGDLEDLEVNSEGAAEGKGAAEGEKRVKLDAVRAIMPPTDFKALFEARSPISHQVVPLQATTQLTSVPRVLEKVGGRYGRYRLPYLGTSGKPLGTVDYARLALSKVHDAPLVKRANAIKIVASLTGGEPVAARAQA